MRKNRRHIGVAAILMLTAACSDLATDSNRSPGAPRRDGGAGTLGSGNVVQPPDSVEGRRNAPSTFVGDASVTGDTTTRGPGTLGSGN